MNAFPFEVVYDYFANGMVRDGLEDDIMPPTLWLVGLNDVGSVGTVRQLDDISSFFETRQTKALMGQFIREAVAEIGDSLTCLVLMSEAYMKLEKGTKAEDVSQKGSLADDPEAKEIVMISVYRPEDMRIGGCPINEDRSVTYAPLQKCTSSAGSMSLNPSKTTFQEEAATAP